MKKTKSWKITLRSLAWMMLVLSVIKLIEGIIILIDNNSIGLPGLNAIIGIISAILILKNRIVGVYLGLVWSGLQFVLVQINTFSWDLSQVIKIGLGFTLQSEPYISVYLNLFALLYVYMLLDKKKEITK